MKTGAWKFGFILFLLVTLCGYGCAGNDTCDWDGLMELVREETGVREELLYGATCGKSRMGNDNALIWYYTDTDSRKKEYFPVEVEQIGKVRYKYVRILEPDELAQDIAIATWMDGYAVFVNNPQCVVVEVTDKNGKVRNEKNENSVYPMIYYYDDGPITFRFLDADGNEIK